MRRHRSFVGFMVAAGVAAVLAGVAGAYPTPSPYPTSWELKLETGAPKRVVIEGKAYWYITYAVANHTGQERVFLPVFEVLTPDGKVARMDRLIPLTVVQTIKKQEGIKFLEQANQIAGEIRLGADQARDGVSIWPEVCTEDRELTFFVSGFSGETAKAQGSDGKEVTLFKTLKLDYAIPGDGKFRQVNEIYEVARSYVFR